MPIKVQCACGKTLTAPDQLAGKRAKCPTCGAAMTIPGPAAAPAPVPLQPAPAAPRPAARATAPAAGVALADAPPQPAKRPLGGSYAQAMASGMAGAKKAAAEPEETPETRKTKTMKIWIGAGAALLGLVLVYVLAARYMASSKLEEAKEHFLFGDMAATTTALQEYIDGASGADKAHGQFLLEQVKLEQLKNTGATLEDSLPVGSDVLGINAASPKLVGGGAQGIRVTLTNNGSKPLTVSLHGFYLRGGSDTVRAGTGGKHGTLPDGHVLEPGQSVEGLVVFPRMPLHGAWKKNAFGAVDQFSLIYNDGTIYVKVPLNY